MKTQQRIKIFLEHDLVLFPGQLPEKEVSKVRKIALYGLCLCACLTICISSSWAVEVRGNNTQWTYIGSAKRGSVIKVHASGVVDFGCRFGACKDAADAGVEGKSPIIRGVFDALKSQITPLSIATGVPPSLGEQSRKLTDVLKRSFSNTHGPNYDEGGVWIQVLTKQEKDWKDPFTRRNMRVRIPYVAPQLYYYWAHSDGINAHGLPIDEDVDVYARAHDGGKTAGSSKNYDDNKGSYQVTIEYTVLPQPEHGQSEHGQSDQHGRGH